MLRLQLIIRDFWRMILKVSSTKFFLGFAGRILPWIIIAIAVLALYRRRKVRLWLLLMGCLALFLLQRYWDVFWRESSKGFLLGLAGNILAWLLVVVLLYVISTYLLSPAGPLLGERMASALGLRLRPEYVLSTKVKERLQR